MTIFVDMDGVIVDLEGTAQRLIGAERDFRTEIEKPNWGMLGDIQNLFLVLEPMPEYKKLWNAINYYFKGEPIEILTAMPKRVNMPDAVNHKRDWIHKHLGKHVRVNFGPYAYDKQFHCKHNDVLIDDMIRNITQWREVGGIGIHHIDVNDTIETIRTVSEGRNAKR
jgi:hypothetical protein